MTERRNANVPTEVLIRMYDTALSDTLVWEDSLNEHIKGVSRAKNRLDDLDKWKYELWEELEYREAEH